MLRSEECLSNLEKLISVVENRRLLYPKRLLSLLMTRHLLIALLLGHDHCNSCLPLTSLYCSFALSFSLFLSLYFSFFISTPFLFSILFYFFLSPYFCLPLFSLCLPSSFLPSLPFLLVPLFVDLIIETSFF